jgi:methionine--tRNA ligase beta chain
MDTVSFKDFAKLDIRIGTVVKARVPNWSHWVIKLTVDFGYKIGERDIFAGMMNVYKPKDLEGKQFPFVINIEPKKIGPEGDLSCGMMLAADFIADEKKPDEGKPVLLNLSEKVPNGTSVR